MLPGLALPWGAVCASEVFAVLELFAFAFEPTTVFVVAAVLLGADLRPKFSACRLSLCTCAAIQQEGANVVRELKFLFFARC
eukprot:3181803-Rhodomonas_salina.1